MYGYQLMQTITDRTNGAWRPSAGAIYPKLQQLEDEGLVQTTAEGGRKLVTLTDAGREFVEQNAESWGDPFAFAGSGPICADRSTTCTAPPVRSRCPGPPSNSPRRRRCSPTPVGRCT